jgi:sugar (pentulose or hexulose) kinase
MDLIATKESCILSIDIGTTYLKCSLFDLNLNIISNEIFKVF